MPYCDKWHKVLILQILALAKALLSCHKYLTFICLLKLHGCFPHKLISTLALIALFKWFPNCQQIYSPNWKSYAIAERLFCQMLICHWYWQFNLTLKEERYKCYFCKKNEKISILCMIYFSGNHFKLLSYQIGHFSI